MNIPQFPLSPEIRQAIAASGGSPIQFEDPETLQVYVLTEQTASVELDEEYIRRELQVALDEFARGEGEPWDIEATIAEAKRQHELRQ